MGAFNSCFVDSNTALESLVAVVYLRGAATVWATFNIHLDPCYRWICTHNLVFASGGNVNYMGAKHFNFLGAASASYLCYSLIADKSN